MRILFIDHVEGDMLAATLYLGLCQEFGPNNVVDWPYKASYHGKESRYPSLYGDGGEGVTGPFQWFPAQPDAVWGTAAVCEQIDRFDCVIVSCRDLSIKALRTLILTVKRDAIRRLAIFDGQDSDDILWNYVDEFAPNVYFKRELLRYFPDRGKTRVLPCPFACVLGLQAPTPKAIDVTDLGAGNYFPGVVARNPGVRDWWKPMPTKEDVDRYLAHAFPSFKGGHVGYHEFLGLTAQAKIGVCFGGYGWDTFRHWEIPAFEGTLLLRNRSPQRMRNPFIDGETCAEFGGPEDLVGTIRTYLEDDDRRERVAKAGNALLRTWHTARERAKYVVNETNR